MEEAITRIPELDIVKWIVIVPLLGAIWNGLLGKVIQKRFGERPVYLVACGSVAFSFAAALYSTILLRAVDGGVVTDRVYPWFHVDELKVSVNFLFDHLSAVMALVVTGVGGLIHVYSIGYMKGDGGYYRYFSFLNLFTFAMLTLVLGDNLFLLFVGWRASGSARTS